METKSTAPMTDEAARNLFTSAIAAQADPQKAARLELAREYFCNPEFRSALQDEVFRTLPAPRGRAVAEMSVEEEPLRVGDTVLCIDDSASFNRLRAGNTYVVEANYDGSPTIFVQGSAHSMERFVRV